MCVIVGQGGKKRTAKKHKASEGCQVEVKRGMGLKGGIGMIEVM